MAVPALPAKGWAVTASLRAGLLSPGAAGEDKAAGRLRAAPGPAVLQCQGWQGQRLGAAARVAA